MTTKCFTQFTSKMSACRWGVELWDCLDQAVSEVAIHNSFLTNTCSKYIRSEKKWII